MMRYFNMFLDLLQTDFFTWKSRATRTQFVTQYAVLLLDALIVVALMNFLLLGLAPFAPEEAIINALDTASNVKGYIFMGTGFALLVFVSVITVFMSIRRLHDIGVSGWWLILLWLGSAFMGIMGETQTGIMQFAMIALSWLPTFALIFLPGQQHENKFGDAPVFKLEEVKE